MCVYLCLLASASQYPITCQVEFGDRQRFSRYRVIGEKSEEASSHWESHGPLTQLQESRNNSRKLKPRKHYRLSQKLKIKIHCSRYHRDLSILNSLTNGVGSLRDTKYVHIRNRKICNK